MEYHEKKYIVDTLNQNFYYNYVDSKRVIYNKENEVVEASELLIFLNEEFKLEVDGALKIILRWIEGDVFANYIEMSSEEII